MNRIQHVKIELVREASALYESSAVRSPSDASEIARKFIGNPDREHLIVMCLDSKNKVTALCTVSIGSLNATVAHPREIFKTAILSNAASIILAHNHPSGDPTPSEPDIELTRRVADVGKTLGIELLDHTVLGDGSRYYSFKENGMF